MMILDAISAVGAITLGNTTLADEVDILMCLSMYCEFLRSAVADVCVLKCLGDTLADHEWHPDVCLVLLNREGFGARDTLEPELDDGKPVHLRLLLRDSIG